VYQQWKEDGSIKIPKFTYIEITHQGFSTDSSEFLNGSGLTQFWCFSNLKVDAGKLQNDLQCLLENLQGYKDSSQQDKGNIFFHCSC